MNRKATIAAIGGLLVCAACGGGEPTTPATPEPTPATGAVLVLTAANFDAEVLQDPGAVMVEFYSPTCPACLSMTAIVDQLGRDFAGRAVVGKVDVSVERGLLGDYAIEYVPTFVFFRAGHEVERHVGTAPRSQLAASLEAAIPN